MKISLFKIANLLLFVLSSVIVFAQPVSTTNTSSPSTCDGSAQFTDSSTVVSTSISWSDSSSVIQQGGYYLFGLCPGVYTVSYSDTSASNQTYTFTIGSGSSNPCNGFYATASAVPSTDTTNCNGSITIYPFGGSSPYSYTWGNTVAGNVSSATNVCAGLGYCVVSDANGCNYTVQYNIPDSSGNGGGPCAGFYASISVSPSTDSLSCNGTASVTVSGGVAPFYYVWNNPVLDSSNYISNLCPGTYTCSITDANGCNYSVQGNITDSTGSTGNPCLGFFAQAVVYPSSDSLSCNGVIAVSAFGGSGTYTYTLATGASSSTGTFTSLCPGNYLVVASDTNNGCYFTVSAVIVDSSYYFPDSSNIISNPSYGDSTITDTLDYSWIYDCAYDLGSIDSAYILGNTLSGADSVIVTWILIDSTGQYIGSYDVSYPTGGSSGVVSVFLTVICPMHAPGDNALIASDQIYLPGASAGIIQSNLSKVNVVNPFEDDLKLTFTETAERNILLYDLKGAIVKHATSLENALSLDTRSLEKGMYVLIIQEGTNFFQTKVIK